MKESIHIYHTNDLHSHFDYWPRISAFLKQRRSMHESVGEDVFIFDIGDHMDKWHPLSEGTAGKDNVKLLNDAGYDAITIGNNEGITQSYEQLTEMYEEAQFDILVANLFEAGGIHPKWVKPYKILKTKKGTKIGVIGLTVFFEKFYRLLGWKLEEPFTALRSIVNDIREKVDIVIVLSHLGINDDEELARQFPQVDLILGGHTHHILNEGKEINGTLLGCAGKHGVYVGQIVLDIDLISKNISHKQAILYESHQLHPVMNEKQTVDNLYQQGKEALDNSVVYLPKKVLMNWFEPSPLPQLLCDGLLQWCNGDIAFLNSGLLLDELNEGVVTRYDIHSICPHPINPCLVDLTGAQLKEVLIQTFDQELIHLQIKGLGFRGKVMGIFVYSGVEIKLLNNQHRYFINGEEINAHKKYKLAIPDMFTFGRYFPEIFRAPEKVYFMPEFLRDVLTWKLQEQFFH